MPPIPSAKETIVETALKLFYQRGIRSTSVDLLIQESGVHKSTFFKHFPSKSDVVIAFLRRRDEKWMEWMKGRVDSLAKKPEGKVLAVFDALGEWFEDPNFRGCAFINTIAENFDDQSLETILCIEHKERFAKYIKKLVGKTNFKRQDALVEELVLIVEGSIVRAQMNIPNAAATAKNIAKQLLAARSSN